MLDSGRSPPLLSTQAGLDNYGPLVARYRDLVLGVVNRLDGHISSPTGEGLLAVFGHPRAHEDDLRRAVLAGLEITREVGRLSDKVHHRFGVELAARAGVHAGWCIWTPSRTTSTASAPTWPRECRVWPRREPS